MHFTEICCIFAMLLTNKKFKDMSDNQEWTARRDAFLKAHPDLPKTKDIECLNLIMKKEFALQILHGEKKVEFRAYGKHYHERLIDKDVANYIDAHPEITQEEVDEFIDLFRPVKKIHFYNYNNTWHLDVKCEDNYIMAVTRPNVEALQEEYNCHEFDEMLADFEKRKDPMRPLLFYFVCGEVLSTNLE